MASRGLLYAGAQHTVPIVGGARPLGPLVTACTLLQWNCTDIDLWLPCVFLYWLMILIFSQSHLLFMYLNNKVYANLLPIFTELSGSFSSYTHYLYIPNTSIFLSTHVSKHETVFFTVSFEWCGFKFYNSNVPILYFTFSQILNITSIFTNFLLEFLRLALTCKSVINFQITLTKVMGKGQCSFVKYFAPGYPSMQTHFRRTNVCLPNVIYIFVQNQSAMKVRIYFQTLFYSTDFHVYSWMNITAAYWVSPGEFCRGWNVSLWLH